MTRLPVPALNPAPEKLRVTSPISPHPLRNTDPPLRVDFRPPLRVFIPLDLYPPNPSPNVLTAQTVALLVPKAAPPCRSPRIAALNIQRQDIIEADTVAPTDIEANE